MPDPALEAASRLVGEDIAHQRRVWRFQRAGWAGLAVFVLLGLVGALGGGPLANAEATSADGRLRARYERIERLGRDSDIVLRFADPAPEVILRGDLVELLSPGRIEPAPESMTRSPGEMRLRFHAPPGGRSEILLGLRSDRPGLAEGSVALGESVVPLRLYILP